MEPMYRVRSLSWNVFSISVRSLCFAVNHSDNGHLTKHSSIEQENFDIYRLDKSTKWYSELYQKAFFNS